MPSLLAILVLGFLLGIKHAFEIDHVVAVSTIASEHKSPMKTALIGFFWGIGHTSTLLLVGLLIMLLKIKILEEVSLFLELLVGIMLVYLGISVIRKNNTFFHSHLHQHGINKHRHPHRHNLMKHFHSHKRSYLIGSIHGLAGSGALMILVLSTIRSTMAGLYYILIFGLGSILSMTLISLILGYPFILARKKFPEISKYLAFATGILSLTFGILVIYEIVKVANLFF